MIEEWSKSWARCGVLESRRRLQQAQARACSCWTVKITNCSALLNGYRRPCATGNLRKRTLSSCEKLVNRAFKEQCIAAVAIPEFERTGVAVLLPVVATRSWPTTIGSPPRHPGVFRVRAPLRCWLR